MHIALEDRKGKIGFPRAYKARFVGYDLSRTLESSFKVIEILPTGIYGKIGTSIVPVITCDGDANKNDFFCGTVPKSGFLGKKKIIFTVLKQKPSKKSKIRGLFRKKKIPQKKSSYRYDRHNKDVIFDKDTNYNNTDEYPSDLDFTSLHQNINDDISAVPPAAAII